ncbi:carbohydrate ABC transporter permease [Alicyclobacillus macrosporangiidus]|uniref:carbohydrate ABC transporter permease n=1 Tax=Alicyclobacillus macrosporangiidus TaxID=392015 RepID=UPI00049560D2|nr:carbohydrate ABC transporter permease [Alicyclobacillus macrosporangiidus]
MHERITPGRRVFLTLNGLFLLVMVATMILPLLNTLAVSFSSSLASMQPGIKLWPHPFSTEGYQTVWGRLQLWLPFLNSVIVTVVGTVVHVILSAMAGYVLIQRDLPGRRTLTTVILLTMMVPWQAIMIPLYVVNHQLGLLNTLTALIMSGLVSGFSIVVMRNFFQSIPYDLAESAMLDGAGHLRIFFRIYLPLAKAGLATVTLFEFVARWNDFTSALLFINDPNKYTLQIALNTIINQSEVASSNYVITENVRMAGIIIGLIPLVLIYPYVQKYFVKGIMMGSTKE